MLNHALPCTTLLAKSFIGDFEESPKFLLLENFTLNSPPFLVVPFQTIFVVIFCVVTTCVLPFKKKAHGSTAMSL